MESQPAFAFTLLVGPLLGMLAWHARDEGLRATLRGLGWRSLLALGLFAYYLLRVWVAGHASMQACYGGILAHRMLGHIYLMPGIAYALMVFPSALSSLVGDSREAPIAAAVLHVILWVIALVALVQTHRWGCFG